MRSPSSVRSSPFCAATRTESRYRASRKASLATSRSKYVPSPGNAPVANSARGVADGQLDQSQVKRGFLMTAADTSIMTSAMQVKKRSIAFTTVGGQ